MSRTPTNFLYANLATIKPTRARLQRTRKVRSRVSADTMKVGVIDVSARAGLLFQVLDRISRKQAKFTFYPVEAAIPMGLGVLDEEFLAQAMHGAPLGDATASNLQNNIDVDAIFPLLEEIRKRVGVDMLVGVFAQMLAFRERDSDDDTIHYWNYFSRGVGNDVIISAYDLRDYARRAGREFEAAVALLAMAQVWCNLYDLNFHPESRGCAFDFCEDKIGLIDVIREVTICDACLHAIPTDERDDVEKCLQAIRDYHR